MKRFDWVRRMYDTIDAIQGEPFAWGKNDCCLFSARVVDAMCDTDFADQLRQEYQDERTAMLYIASFGSIKAALEYWLGKPQSLIYAQRGDVMLFDNDGRDTVGIFVGDGIISTGETGLVRVSKDSALHSWAVR
jgi:hypothetical protein